MHVFVESHQKGEEKTIYMEKLFLSSYVTLDPNFTKTNGNDWRMYMQTSVE